MSSSRASSVAATEETSNWQKVPANKRRREPSPAKTSSRKTLKTNYWSTLSVDEPETQKDVTPNSPPIFLPGIINIKDMVLEFDKVIPNSYHYKTGNSDTKVMVKTIDNYRKLVKFLENSKISFHTFQIKQECAYRIVVKNLHHSTPVEDIKSAIEDQGHVVRNVINLKSRQIGRSLPIFFIDLEPATNNKEAYNIKSIGNALIKVEPPKKTNDIVQCYRCQQFGHTKRYCNRPFNCVKCGLGHDTKECLKTTDIAPRCVNCLQTHPANYKGCQIYQKILHKKSPTKRQNSFINKDS